jgi:RNA polymerase sigma-70 factor (ECF subfamily)
VLARCRADRQSMRGVTSDIETCAPTCARLCTADGFAEAYAEYASALLARAYRLVGDRASAEEIVQETFLRAWRACGSFAPSAGSLRAWLFTICRNVAFDVNRSQATRPRMVAATMTSEWPDRETADPVDEIEQLLTRYELTEALAQLSTAHREILVAAFVHDRPYGEIAEEFGIPAGTVKSRVFHALRALRGHIAVDQ